MLLPEAALNEVLALCAPLHKHVVLPPDAAKILPKNRLLSENLVMAYELTTIEWRGIWVHQSRGWVHYAIHRPEPHIMFFRRPLNYQQNQ
ncbi:hypothetical protein O6H91_11G110800 [Diphasiastrum complanatum]|uniref:Uncharacterized protein n=1 Tax=Diphasiastrum complanatum TaxID=34168 RepID=A0ACC2CCU8_DIPCM|nr:hypothetical protein O6H91_11G110800 [Diphasiastrum complanatum]